jgi:DNA repair protein RecO (recombination protein O)
MISKTEAIVINRVKYNDNSYIVNFYSLEFGRFAAIVRIPKSKKAEIKPSILFPLNILEIEVKIKETRTIQSLNFCNSAVSLKT